MDYSLSFLPFTALLHLKLKMDKLNHYFRNEISFDLKIKLLHLKTLIHTQVVIIILQ